MSFGGPHDPYQPQWPTYGGPHPPPPNGGPYAPPPGQGPYAPPGQGPHPPSHYGLGGPASVTAVVWWELRVLRTRHGVVLRAQGRAQGYGTRRPESPSTTVIA
ncbi:hypothetical protein AB0M97_21360 [Streptomyces sp. NPDC051207]|uniref:hypothetical protein n=1 Tax=Streptomyces sp. NPDC051207 TaxID=3154641 RepID=UPI003446662E